MDVGLKPVYYFYGEEELLIEEEVARIKKGALAGGLEEFNYNRYYGPFVDPTELINVAMTLPMMAPRRMILVKEAEGLKADKAKAMAVYLEDPSPTTCLVFVSTKIDKRSKLYKIIDKKGVARAFYPLKDHALRGWIKKEAAGEGKTITIDAVTRLIAIAGPGLKSIRGELTKIVLFVGKAKEITLEDVEAAGIDVKERTIFELSDAIGSKDVRRALGISEKLSSEPPLMVLSAIARHMRIIIKTKALVAAGVPGDKIAYQVGTFPKYVNQYIKGAAAFGEEELKRAFRLLAVADRDFKGGSTLPPGVVMTRLVLSLCGAR